MLRLIRIVAAAALVSTAAHAATPPPQPKSGPGGADYVATEVAKRAVGRASAATYVFHPAEAAKEPRPVVVFMHAWGAVNPQVYGGWIDHLARKGFVVLYPRFQEVGRTRPADATDRALALLKDAFAQLEKDEQARPDLKRVAVIGHLAGVPLALNYAVLAEEKDLPKPALVFAVMPGGIATDPKSRGVALKDLSGIDPSTLLITLIGDREHLAADRASRRILREADKVPNERKLFMRALSDDYGFPSLSATLASPGSFNEAYDATRIKLPPDPPRDPKAPRERQQRWSADMALTGEQTVLVNQLGIAGTDTLDWYAYWKTFDMAAAAAFAGRDGASLRAEAAFTDMGRWSDGWPVKRLSAEHPREGPAPARREVAPAQQPVPSKRR